MNAQTPILRTDAAALAPLRTSDLNLSRYTSRDLLDLLDGAFAELNGRSIFGETVELDDVFAVAETQVDNFTHRCRDYLDARVAVAAEGRA